MPRKTPAAADAILPSLGEAEVDSKMGDSISISNGGIEAITMMMHQMMRQQSEVQDLNRKLEKITEKKKKIVSKKAAEEAMEKRTLAKAKLLYYYDIRDKNVSWATTVLAEIEKLLQESPRLWEILDKEIPTDVLKKLCFKHFTGSDLPANIREQYIEKAKAQVQIQDSK